MAKDGLDAILQRQASPHNDAFTLFGNPLKFLAQTVYRLARSSPYRSLSSVCDPVRVVCVSDTHNAHDSIPSLPHGDILVHSGDLSQSGTLKEVQEALDWLADQQHPHKIVIAGNHDACLADESLRSAIDWKRLDITYLQDSSTFLNVNGRKLHVYGSPYTPKYGSWVFQYPPSRTKFNGTASAHQDSPWASLPPSIDILVTHGPPQSHLDLGHGCPDLLAAVWRVRPRLHVFGHTHAGRGIEKVAWTSTQLLYEKIIGGQGAWWGLFALVLRVVGTWWNPASDHTGHNDSTVMVNAASLTGWRDEERNPALAIDI